MIIARAVSAVHVTCCNTDCTSNQWRNGDVTSGATRLDPSKVLTLRLFLLLTWSEESGEFVCTHFAESSLYADTTNIAHFLTAGAPKYRISILKYIQYRLTRVIFLFIRTFILIGQMYWPRIILKTKLEVILNDFFFKVNK